MLKAQHAARVALPAGSWLLLATMLIRTTRVVRGHRLISASTTLVFVRWAGRLHRAGFTAWRRNGGKWHLSVPVRSISRQ